VSWLIQVRGPWGKTDRRVEGSSVRIGRNRDNDIAVEQEAEASRHHLMVEVEGSDLIVEDLSSLNGTFFKGRRMQFHKVTDGDVLRIGFTEFSFVKPGGEEHWAGEALRPPPKKRNRRVLPGGGPQATVAGGRQSRAQSAPSEIASTRRAGPGGRKRPSGASPKQPKSEDDSMFADEAGAAVVSSGGADADIDDYADYSPGTTETEKTEAQGLIGSGAKAEVPTSESGRRGPARASTPPRSRRPEQGSGRRGPRRPGSDAEARRRPGSSSGRRPGPEGQRPPGARQGAAPAAAQAPSAPRQVPAAAPTRPRAPAAPLASEPAAPVVHVVAEEDHGDTLSSRPEGWPDGLAPRDPRNMAQKILLAARKERASDVHIMPDSPVILRVNGELQPFRAELSAGQVDRLISAILTSEQRAHYDRTGDYDFCYAFEGGGRFRTNVARHSVGGSLSLRVVKPRVMSLEELGLPPAAQKLTTFAQGLVLVTGPVGSGKTTSAFSLVKLINDTRSDHIITIEDPIEFVLKSTQCLVSQREIGTHTVSFHHALRGALREDPDIIVLGDLRDHEAAGMAIEAAETGHLVFASMQSMNAMKTLDKLIDLFPAGEQASIRQVVSESLRGVLCQKLLPGTEGTPVAACELLFNSIAVANIIREGKTANLRNAMQLGKAQGMRTLDASLNMLLDEGKITARTARSYADNPEKFPVEEGENGDA